MQHVQKPQYFYDQKLNILIKTMRKPDRSLSPEFRLGKSSSNDIAHHRPEPFSKTFKKKYQAFEPTSISTTNLIKTFAKTRLPDKKPPKDSPSKTIERRSSSKPTLEKHIQRLSLNSQTYQQQGLSTSSKLIIINNIFSRKSFATEPKDLLEKIYEHNEEYLEQLCEWQKLEIYDEVDKLVYKLTQNYLTVIEQLLQKIYHQFHQKLTQCETQISKISEENAQLRQETAKMKQNAALMANLEDKLVEEYHRNQWSTLFLTEISKQHFDLESFVKTIPIFTRMGALNQSPSHSALLPPPLDNPHRSVFAEFTQPLLLPKNIKSAGHLSDLEQLVKNRQQQPQFSIK